MKWYNPQKAPFSISGFPFYESDGVYRRLPLTPSHPLPEAVERLADETAGGQIRFHAKLKQLKIEVSLSAKPLYFANVKAPHLAQVTKSAFDLYASRDGEDYVFLGVASEMSENDRYYTAKLLDYEEEAELDFLLNFPLYGGVDKILIGVDDEAEISPAHKAFIDNQRLVIYGTSVQQGGCAGRPGMSESNLLSRWMNREVCNLGFNSSGKAEPEMAHIIGGIGDIAALIISIEGNCPDKTWLDEKLRAFIQIFRSYHREVPIVIIPFFISGKDMLDKRSLAERLNNREIQQKIVDDFNSSGDERVYLHLQDNFIETEFDAHSVWHECTADGLHANDLGFYWKAKALYTFLKETL